MNRTSWMVVALLAGVPALAADAKPAPAQASNKLAPKPAAAAPAPPQPAAPAPAADAAPMPQAPSADADTVDGEAPRGSAALPKARAPFKPVVRKGAKGRDVVVITNDQLESLYGPSTPVRRRTATAGPDGAAGSNGAAKQDAPAAGAADGAAAADPAQRAEAIRQELERLDQKAKYIRNPYLKPPQESAEERTAEQGMSATQLLARTQEQMQRLREELKKAPAPGDGAEGSGPQH